VLPLDAPFAGALSRVGDRRDDLILGGLVSTPDDWHRFARLLLGGVA